MHQRRRLLRHHRRLTDHHHRTRHHTTLRHRRIPRPRSTSRLFRLLEPFLRFPLQLRVEHMPSPTPVTRVRPDRSRRQRRLPRHRHIPCPGIHRGISPQAKSCQGKTYQLCLSLGSLPRPSLNLSMKRLRPSRLSLQLRNRLRRPIPDRVINPSRSVMPKHLASPSPSELLDSILGHLAGPISASLRKTLIWKSLMRKDLPVSRVLSSPSPALLRLLGLLGPNSIFLRRTE